MSHTLDSKIRWRLSCRYRPSRHLVPRARPPPQVEDGVVEGGAGDVFDDVGTAPFVEQFTYGRDEVGMVAAVGFRGGCAISGAGWGCVDNVEAGQVGGVFEDVYGVCLDERERVVGVGF